MRVIVVGGGIGGTAVAIALLKQGMDPVVLEQSPLLGEVGAGIVVAPNAMRALAYLDAADHVRQNGVEMLGSTYRELDGELIFQSPVGSTSARYGEGRFAMHRADLLAGLAGKLPKNYVILNSRVAAVRETYEGVEAILENGQVVFGDALIGADGIRSNVRQSLFGKDEPQFTGLLGWRALISRERAPNLPCDPITKLWFAPGRHLGFYPIRRNEILNLFAWIPATEVLRESWTLSGDVADLKKSLAGASTELQLILEEVQEAFITPLYIRSPIPSWGRGRITLLGDAAHPTTAAAGQGSAMALEDAVTLAICLKRHGRENIAAAFREYEARRIPRTTRMQAISLSNNNSYNESDPTQRQARNGRFRGLRSLGADTPTSWLYGYDAINAAREPLKMVLSAGTMPNTRKRRQSRRAFDIWSNALGFADRARLWRSEREGYERFVAREFPPADGTLVEELLCNGLRLTKVGRGSGPVVLHLHGGAYTMGSARAAIEVAHRISSAVDGPVFIPDYRLAPEHPFPAASDDVLAAYRWLRKNTDSRRGIILTGECAGGALAVGLAIALREAGERLPDAVHVTSPFCDLSLSSPSIESNAGLDPWFNRESLTLLAASYVQQADPKRADVSPVYADLKGMPPLFIYAAEDELLRDDAVRLADAAKLSGVDAKLSLISDSVHSFVLFDFLPEAKQSIDDLAKIAARSLN